MSIKKSKLDHQVDDFIKSQGKVDELSSRLDMGAKVGGGKDIPHMRMQFAYDLLREIPDEEKTQEEEGLSIQVDAELERMTEETWKESKGKYDDIID